MNTASQGMASPYLDPDTQAEIEDMMDGDQEMVIDLIDTMTEAAPELLAELQAGIQTGEAKRISDAAHALKSSAAQLGALPFSRLCLQLEQWGKAADVAAARHIQADIEPAFQHMIQALQAWKQALRRA